MSIQTDSTIATQTANPTATQALGLPESIGTTSSPNSSSTIDDRVSVALPKDDSDIRKHARASSGLSPHRLEKMIQALAKLIEAFASLTRARKEVSTQSQDSAGTKTQDLPSNQDEQTSTTPSAADGGDSAAVQPSLPPTESSPSETATPSQTPLSEISNPFEPSSNQVLEAQPDSAELILPNGVPIGTPMQYTSGFLWKPVSDKDNRLAVLLPARLTGRVAAVAVISPDGKRTLQSAKYSGVGNGDREHYRFTKPGGQFPDGSILLVKMKDGTRHHVVIRETSARVEK